MQRKTDYSTLRGSENPRMATFCEVCAAVLLASRRLEKNLTNCISRKFKTICHVYLILQSLFNDWEGYVGSRGEANYAYKINR